MTSPLCSTALLRQSVLVNTRFQRCHLTHHIYPASLMLRFGLRPTRDREDSKRIKPLYCPDFIQKKHEEEEINESLKSQFERQRLWIYCHEPLIDELQVKFRTQRPLMDAVRVHLKHSVYMQVYSSVREEQKWLNGQ